MDEKTKELELGSGSLRYKAMLRSEISRYRELKGSHFTQSALAVKLGIEASYLSRCLHHSEYHPSRELLFRILRAVEVQETRVQEHLEVYDLEQASNTDYRRFLEFREKIGSTRRSVEKLLSIRPRIQRIAQALDKISEEIDPSGH